MVLGIPYMWWVIGLGLVAVALVWPSKKNKSLSEEDASRRSFEISESIEEMIAMRWVRLRVNPEDLDTVLNMIEELKISVMYQFFLREHKYDMFFRCQKSKLEDFKKALAEYIPKH